MLSRHKKSRMHHWSIEEVETLSTNAIIRKLRDFGVDFREKQFLVDVKRFYSAEELADLWVSVFPISAVNLYSGEILTMGTFFPPRKSLIKQEQTAQYFPCSHDSFPSISTML